MLLRNLLLLPLALVVAHPAPADISVDLDKARDEFLTPPHSLSIRAVGDLGAVQHLLGAKGHPVGVDGLWGPESSGAVTAFQGGAGLSADGIPGPATLGALVDQISQGSTGGVVSAAQVLLAVEADGDFGPATNTATTTFQSGKGLTADGIIGRDTWTALFSTSAPPKSLPPNDPPAKDPPSKSTPKAVLAGAARLLTDDELKSLRDPGRYAAAAYCKPEGWNDWSCHKCVNGPPFTKFYARGGGGFIPEWYVIGNGASVVVGIRGSEGLTWVDNFVAYLKPVSKSPDWFPGGQDLSLHGGFYDSFSIIIPAITLAVKVALSENKGQILVSGHSQGAALATLVATSLQARLDATVTLRAFSPPRQGNPAWAKYVDATLGNRVWRLTNNNDMVTNLPLMGMGYRHTSGEVWRTIDGQWILCYGQESPWCGMGKDAVPRGIESHTGPFPPNIMMGCGGEK
ncbi:hypothetical protein CcaverHIS002_0606310 [Cutaneotrichosporon cavernicola]|nr:hypothetical protein CcaverHIS002_0606310 [Cutaneotrichosporon cavernicola]